VGEGVCEYDGSTCHEPAVDVAEGVTQVGMHKKLPFLAVYNTILSRHQMDRESSNLIYLK
jgi:hypothetical protein